MRFDKEPSQRRSRFRMARFSLSSLLIAMALASVLLAWAVHSPSPVVRANLQIKANPRPLIGEPAPFSPQEFADFRVPKTTNEVNAMKTIGLVGGVASGKSVVSRMLV